MTNRETPAGSWLMVTDENAGRSGAEHINEIFKEHEKLAPNCSSQWWFLGSLLRSCFQSIPEAHSVPKQAWLLEV